MTSEPDWVAVGRIARAHGVKGEVSVVPLSDVSSRFDAGARVFAGATEDRPLTVSSSRPHAGRVLVSFDEVADRDAAERLRGEYLFVPAASTPPLPDGEYWPHELIGCQVVTEDGRPLGPIREILRTQANDVWVAAGPDGEVLIPALVDIVVSVDVEARGVVVRSVPGLTAP
ncbi:MAG: 16S rRNA processing protein RimM [Actinobacteria bacterium]|nr:16S rRNA processing protein RimM [Actinomycetota bacterium]